MTKTFRFELYPGWLRVYSDLDAWRKSTGHEDIPDNIGGIYCSRGDEHHVWCDGSPGSAAHEAVHLAVALMDNIGHSVNPDSDEPMAYLVGWATGRILSVCKRSSDES